MNANTCTCGSGRAFDACCGPYLAGSEPAPTAEALMRSRFSAYCRADVDYLERTSGGQALAEFSRKDASAWARSASFTKLEVLATEGGERDDTRGVVDFAATYDEAGKTHVLRERSLFAKEAGVWTYVGRDKGVSVKRDAPKVGRNDPCPCGSGQKYKKCHGA